MPPWDDLRLFLACYRGRSATRAAKELLINVSTVSRRLDRLEGELGVALFLRGNDGLVPTDAAERMFEAAQEAERRMAEAFGSVASGHDEVSGAVRLSSTSDLADFILVPMLAPLLAAHPQLELELVLGTELSDLSRREADLAVRIGHPGEEPEIVVRHLRDEPMGLYASTRYLDERPATLPLAEHRWLVLGSSTSPPEGIDAWLRAQVPDAQVALRSNNFTTLRLAAGAGLGVAILPEMYAAITPFLHPLPGAEQVPPASLYVVAHRATRRSLAVRAVWDFLVDLLTPRPDRDDIAVMRAAVTAGYGVRGWEDATDANQSASKVRPVRRE